MIIRNEEKYLSGSFHGLVHSAGFKCTLDTVSDDDGDSIFSVIHTFENPQDRDNYVPVAEALLTPNLPQDRLRDIHNRFLIELSNLGDEGLSLGDVIEEVFGVAKRSNIVLDYENNALLLISATGGDQASQNQSQNQSYEYLLRIMRKIEEQIGRFPIAAGNTGGFDVHPALQRELERPVNRGLKATLTAWLRRSET